ncbi:MAG: hypothetical protein U1F87_12530 [Kiritimatiellia bacterium]
MLLAVGVPPRPRGCNGPDLAAMFADRSTLVEIVTVVLVAVLARFAPAAGAEAPRG